MDCEKKLRVYSIILSRYADYIEEKEVRSLSEIRFMISPYSEFIQKLKNRLWGKDNFVFERDFFSAVERVLEYIKGIENIELPISFWLTFEEMDSLKAGTLFEQALLITALLRSFGSGSAKTIITKRESYFVIFEWKGESYLINPKTGSLLSGDDVQKLLSEEGGVAYSFNDIEFKEF